MKKENLNIEDMMHRLILLTKNYNFHSLLIQYLNKPENEKEEETVNSVFINLQENIPVFITQVKDYLEKLEDLHTKICFINTKNEKNQQKRIVN